MRTIKADSLGRNIYEMILKASFDLPEKVLDKIKDSLKVESSATGKKILNDIALNAQIAKDERVPLCQDTGFALFFVKKGYELQIEGSLEKVITTSVEKAYEDGYLRKSILSDPLTGVNTGNNTPPIIWYEETEGDKLEIIFAPKGGGAENMSRVKMFKPADGVEGIKEFVVETVKRAGGNPCPPIVVGVGIGGTFEKCAWLAKKAILRDPGDAHATEYYRDLEAELLSLVNQTGIGPGGLGGETTAFAVNVETYPRHIAILPVAVNIQCHSARHSKITL